MNEGIITTRYTKALFQTAEEEKKSSVVYNDIIALEGIIKESPEFAEFLISPVLKESEKEKIIIQLFKESLDPLSLNFISLLIKNKREQHLPSICRCYQNLHKEKSGIQEGSILTAIPLEKKYKEEINQLIRRKFNVDIDLEEKVDPSIIGGFVLRIEDQQIDASISSQLKKIKTQLINL